MLGLHPCLKFVWHVCVCQWMCPLGKVMKSVLVSGCLWTTLVILKQTNEKGA